MKPLKRFAAVRADCMKCGEGNIHIMSARVKLRIDTRKPPFSSYETPVFVRKTRPSGKFSKIFLADS